MAAPAVGRSQRALARATRVRPRPRLCRPPSLSPQSRSPLSRRPGARGTPGQRAFIPGGSGGRGLCGELAASPRLSEATLHFRPPALCPGRRGCGGTGPSQVCPARGPTQASPVGPKVWFFAKIFGFLRRGHPLSSTLSPGQVSFPKHQGPFSPPKKPGRTELSHRPFQSCACEAQLRGTFKVAGLRFVSLRYIHQNPQLQGHLVIEGERTQDLKQESEGSGYLEWPRKTALLRALPWRPLPAPPRRGSVARGRCASAAGQARGCLASGRKEAALCCLEHPAVAADHHPGRRWRNDFVSPPAEPRRA